MAHKDSAAKDFGYEIVSPVKRGPAITSSLYIAFLIVLAFALISAAELNSLISHVNLVNVPGDRGTTASAVPLSEFAGSEVSRSLLFEAASVLIAWPLIAWGLNQAAGAFFGGRGKFYPDMLAGIGFTYGLKAVAGLIVLLLISWMPAFELDYQQISGNTGTALDYAGHILSGNPYYQIAYYVQWLGVVLSCCYGVIVLRKIEGIKLWQAAIVIGVPLFVYAGLEISGFLNIL